MSVWLVRTETDLKKRRNTKITKKIKYIVLLVLVCLLYGQEENSEKAPLVITITSVKQQYKINENWQFELKIENTSNDTVRVLRSIDCRYSPQAIRSDGEQFIPMLSIVASLPVDETNTIELAPGHFYGKKCTWIGMEQAGNYVFKVNYLTPLNIGDSLPHYWRGQIESNKIKIIVK